MVFFGVGLVAIILACCAYFFLNEQKQEPAVVYHRYFGISLPSNYKNFKCKKYFTGRVYVEYELPRKDLEKIIQMDLAGYTSWKLLTEGGYGTPERDYDNETNPGALACKKITRRELTFIVADLNRGMIFGFYGPQ